MVANKLIALIGLLIILSAFVSGCSEDTELEEVEEILSESDLDFKNNDEEFLVTGQGHLVRMEGYNVMRPSEITINRGDTISWRSYYRLDTYTLISNDGLFDDQELKFGDVYRYMFTDFGTYTFSVENYPEMILTVSIT